MLPVGAALYALSVVSLPAGSHVVLPATGYQALWSPESYRRPTTVSIADDGTIGAVVERDGKQYVWITSHGRTNVLSAPGDALLSPFFFAATPGARGERTYPNAAIQNLVVSGTDTYISVGSSFTGGYSGYEEHTFSWNGATWIDASPPSYLSGTRNTWIAAASGTTTTLVADFADVPAGENESEPNNPHFHEDRILRHSRSGTDFVGGGIATACAGNLIVGYDAGYRSTGYAPNDPIRTSAILWDSKVRSSLGPGIAWAVNRQGDVVGDDRESVRGKGHPTLWRRRGKAERLVSAFGSAFGINDAGTIVGVIDGKAYVAGVRTKRRPQLLDDIVTPRRWRIVAAYGIANDGTILALATKGKGPTTLVTLRRRG